mmetsp:Transcript_40236/g.79506  ORF Transcript_40236/g.79506 Transcript_40236/m.79506 type:complete len:105 (-) Transcript_40236:1436-1750(-)
MVPTHFVSHDSPTALTGCKRLRPLSAKKRPAWFNTSMVACNHPPLTGMLALAQALLVMVKTHRLLHSLQTIDDLAGPDYSHQAVVQAVVPAFFGATVRPSCSCV